MCGLRRRGYTPTSIFTFVREAGISKSDNLIDMRQLEACIRSELDLTAQRRIAVLDPVKLIVDNYPEDKTEYFDVANNPNREANDTTTRKVAFTRELWIENEDFAEVPPPKFKRLTLGGEVRPPQLGRAFGRKRDVPLALIPFLGVVFSSAMAQQIDPHGVVSFFILLPPHYSRFPQKIQADHGSFLFPRLPQHSFWFAISNHAYLHDTPARLLSSAKSTRRRMCSRCRKFDRSYSYRGNALVSARTRAEMSSRFSS